jgi:uncharacterized protein DUF4410
MPVSARRLTAVLCALVLVTLASSAAHARKTKATPGGPLDEGRLDPAYFGGSREFREAEDIDYLWVKEGFAIDGHTFQFAAWPDPVFLGDAKPDADDHRLAHTMNDELPRLFQEALATQWSGRAKTSMTEGDVRVEGRIVDCSTGSVAAKAFVGFGAGAGNTTIDLRFNDAKTGELLAAVHQRVVSGTTWSTTDSKMAHWIDKFGKDVAKDGFARLYEKGKVADE